MSTPRTLPTTGKHQAKLAGKPVVYVAESGAHCVALPVSLIGEVAWSGKETMTWAKSNGELMTKTIEKLKRIFGWDGIDPFWLEDADLTEVVFEVEGEQQPYTPKATDEDPNPEETTIWKIVYINPVGGYAAMPESGDRKAILAKFGSKLRALNGGKAAATPKPAAVAPAAKPEPAAKPAGQASGAKPAPKSNGPPSRKNVAAVARTSSEGEVWAALEKQNAEAEEDAKLEGEALAEKYFSAQEEVAPGTNGELDPQQWGAVADKLGL